MAENSNTDAPRQIYFIDVEWLYAGTISTVEYLLPEGAEYVILDGSDVATQIKNYMTPIYGESPSFEINISSFYLDTGYIYDFDWGDHYLHSQTSQTIENTTDLTTAIDSIVNALSGNWADNTLRGGNTADTLFGYRGNDTLYGGRGEDQLLGGRGNDILYGEDGRDELSGGEGDDKLYGGAGLDGLHGGAGHDTLEGGAGDDTLEGGAGNDVLNGGVGDDYLYGGTGDDTLYGGVGDDWIEGGSGDDTLEGGDGHDTYVQYADGGTNLGNDTIIGFDNEEDSIIIFGGATYSVSDDNQTLTVSSIYSSATIYGTVELAGTDVFTSDLKVYAEGVLLSPNIITGTSGNDTLAGTANDDVIKGLGGDDRLYGNDGDDTLYGGDGRDTLNGGAGDNKLYGGDGNDSIDGGAGDDYIDGGNDGDLIAGWGGNDIILGGEGVDIIFAGDGNDRLEGGAGRDTIYGRGGSDTLNGGTGNDSLFGEAGNDMVWGGDGDDVIKGGYLDGDDTGRDAYGNDKLYGEAGNDRIWGGDGHDTLEGGSGNDRLEGGSGNDSLEGGSGNDRLEGGAGNDSLEGGSGNDRLEGGAGWDIIGGNEGDDTLYGGADNDDLYGDEGNDKLYGGDGNDTLHGGEGDDRLEGGAGKDSFVIAEMYGRRGEQYGTDTIVDFDNEEDVIIIDMGRTYSLSDDNQTLTVTSRHSDARVYGVVKLDGADVFTEDLKVYDTRDNLLPDPDAGPDITFDHAGTATFNENDPNGLNFGVNATSAAGHSLTYNIVRVVGTDLSYASVSDFDIDQYNGTLTLENPSGLDFEKVTNDENFIIVIEAVSQGGTIESTTVTLAVNDVDDEDAVLESASSVTINGSINNKEALYLMDVSDVDVISSGNSNVFNFTVAGVATLDSEGNLTATDDVGFRVIRTDTDKAELYYDSGSLTAGEYVITVQTSEVDSGAVANHQITLDINTASIELRGDSGGNTLTGGSGNDTLNGYAGADTLIGLAGNDILYGGDGNDILRGGRGNDRLEGGNGNDMIFGHENNDRIYGGEGNDSIYAGSGNDTIYGGDGNDILHGDDGADKLYGGDGADRLTGSAGADTLYGEADDDELHGGDDNDFLYGGTGKDTIYGDRGNDELIGGDGDDSLYGGAGADKLYGYAGNDWLVGGAGADTYVFAWKPFGTDTITGFENGTDIIQIDAGAEYTISADNQTMTVTMSSDVAGDDATSTIRGEVRLTGTDTFDENLRVIDTSGNAIARTIVDRAIYGGDENDYLYGTANDDVIKGLGGDDRIWGYDGNDTLYGGAGDDNIYGRSGDDTIYGGDGRDRLKGHDGNDILYGGAGGDDIDGDDGDDTLYGGDGDDWLRGDAGKDTYVFSGTNFGNDTITSFENGTDIIQIDAGAEYTISEDSQTMTITRASGDGATSTIHGRIRLDGRQETFTKDLKVVDADGNAVGSSVFNETIHGTESRDTITGTVNDNVIKGFGGDDRIYGKAGDDMLYGGDGSDKLYGGDGNDTLNGGDGGDNLYGGAGNDKLYGGDSRDWLEGGAGDDTVYAAGGNDRVYGNEGNDKLYGGAGRDWLIAGDGNDTLYSGDGDDWLNGDDGDDTLYGGDGDDHLTGDGGDDTLEGGAGSDTYFFLDDYSRTSFGNDTIIGFDSSEDTIQLYPSNYSIPSPNRSVRYDISADDQTMTVTSSHNIYGTIKLAGTGRFDENLKVNFYGDRLDNIMIGGDGNDTFSAGDGDDTLEGKAGNDTYIFKRDDFGNDTIIGFDNNEDTIQLYYNARLSGGWINAGTAKVDYYISADNQTLTVTADDDANTIYGTIKLTGTNTFNENLKVVDDQGNAIARSVLDKTIHGTAGRDSLYGTANDDIIYGYASSDNLLGRDGDDTLHGGSGGDRLYGEAGNDTLYGETGNDTLYGGDGNDTLDGGDGNDTLSGGDGNDTLDSGGGVDIHYFTGTDFGSDTIIGFDNNEDLIELYYNDIDFRYYISADDQTMTVTAADEPATIYGTITLAGTDKFTQDLEVVLKGDRGNDRIIGEDGKDTLLGRAGDDWLFGGNNDDKLYGEGGDDYLDGEWGNDTLYGGAGHDRMAGASGNDTLYGDDGNDTMRGGTGNDLLFGGNGNDIIYGDEGDDTLEGGAGSDTYVVSGADFGNDTLIGFDSSEDTIKLSYNARTAFFGGGSSKVDYYISEDNQTLTVTDDDDANTIYGTIKLDGTDTFDANFKAVDSAGNAIARSIVDTTIYGTEGNDRLTGTVNDDVIKGRGGNDRLYGENGDDYLDGGFGDDTLYGGDGDDRLYGDETLSLRHWYTLSRESGDDTLYGGDGNDTLDGGYGNDTLNGGDGNDTLEGYYGDDTLNGGEGNDRLNGSVGNDTLNGDDGHDSLRGWTGNDTLYGGDGNDTLDGGEGIDALYGGSGDDYLDGGYGDDNDKLWGGLGNDKLNGRKGNDTLEGGAGADTYYFTNTIFGNDTIIGFDNNEDIIELDYYDVDFRYYISADDQTMTVTAANNAANIFGTITLAGTDKFTQDLEVVLRGGAYGDNRIIGEDAKDTIYGGFYNDTFFGNAGNDILYGVGGDDHLYGGDGDDYLKGGSGDDTLNGGDGDDTLDGGRSTSWFGEEVHSDTYVVSGTDFGDDVIVGFNNSQDTIKLDYANGIADYYISDDNQTLTVTDADDANAIYGTIRLEGTNVFTQDLKAVDSAGNAIARSVLDKTIYGTAGNDTITGTVNADVIKGLAGRDYLVGGDGNDDIYGGDGNDKLHGGDDNDLLLGGDGDDTLYGGDGGDSLHGHSGNDKLYGGDGVDYLYGWGDDDYLYGEGGNDTLVGGGGDDKLYGNDGDDYLYGEGGNDTLEGGDGNDWLRGHDGNDTLNGGDGRDHLLGGDGNDTLNGGDVRDSLSGGDGNDTLNGGDGDDTLNGGSGGDVLHGGNGDDTLIGGGGKDTYIVSGKDFGNDTIIGFDSNEDKITIDEGVNYYISDDSQTLTVTKADDANTIYGTIELDGTDTFDANFKAVDSAGNAIARSVLDKTIYGTAGNDTITGTVNADVIKGLGGDDRLVGDNGDDKLYGGNGNDTLLGWKGNDDISGGWGNDWMQGGDGNDTLNGGDGRDRLDGNDGDDTLNGGDGNDNLNGGFGKDTYIFSNSFGNDKIYYFENEKDTIVIDDGATYSVSADNLTLTVTSAADANTIYGTIKSSITAFNQNLRVVDSAGNAIARSIVDKTIYGTAGDDKITGTANDDVIKGLGGDDKLSGGDGIDIIYGGDGDDILYGGGVSSALYRAGFGDDKSNDTLIGGNGDDTLNGWGGDDTLNGGAGADTYIFFGLNFGNDTIIGFENDKDTIVLPMSTWYADIETGATLPVLAGYNISDDNQTLTVSSLNGDRVRGTITLEGKNVFTEELKIVDRDGNAITRKLDNQDAELVLANGITNASADGDYTIASGTNIYTMEVKDPDTYSATNSPDEFSFTVTSVIHNGKASNVDFTATRSDIEKNKADISYESGILQGGTYIITVQSTELDSNATADHELTFTVSGPSIGTAGNDTIKGTDGDDIIYGKQGWDTIYGLGGNDILYGEQGWDVLYGGDGNDTLIGGKSKDRLYGEAGNDKLYGGEGNDRLEGGAGDDFMDGGDGAEGDLIYIRTKYFGNDTIANFDESVDYIQLQDKYETAVYTMSDDRQVITVYNGYRAYKSGTDILGTIRLDGTDTFSEDFRLINNTGGHVRFFDTSPMGFGNHTSTVALDENQGGTSALNLDLQFAGSGNFKITNIDGLIAGTDRLSADDFIISSAGVLSLDKDGLDREAIVGLGDVGTITVGISGEAKGRVATTSVTLEVNGLNDEDTEIEAAWLFGRERNHVRTDFPVPEGGRFDFGAWTVEIDFNLVLNDLDIGTSTAISDLDILMSGDADYFTLDMTSNEAPRLIMNSVDNITDATTQKIVDYETQPTYYLTLNVNDGGNISDDYVLTFNIMDADDEAATLESAPEKTIYNAEQNQVIYYTELNDPDATSSLGNNGLFYYALLSATDENGVDVASNISIDEETGRITYTSGTSAADSTYTIKFRATERDNSHDSAVVSHTISLAFLESDNILDFTTLQDDNVLNFNSGTSGMWELSDVNGSRFVVDNADSVLSWFDSQAVGVNTQDELEYGYKNNKFALDLENGNVHLTFANGEFAVIDNETTDFTDNTGGDYDFNDFVASMGGDISFL